MSLRFIKFVISRFLGTLVDTLVLWILTQFIFFSYVGQYVISPAISFEVAMFHNYLLSYFFIWHNDILKKSSRDFFSRLITYNISALFGFFIKMGFLLLLERIFRWDVVVCNIIALFFSGFVNFFVAEKLVFKKHHIFIADDYKESISSQE